MGKAYTPFTLFNGTPYIYMARSQEEALILLIILNIHIASLPLNLPESKITTWPGTSSADIWFFLVLCIFL